MARVGERRIALEKIHSSLTKIKDIYSCVPFGNFYLTVVLLRSLRVCFSAKFVKKTVAKRSFKTLGIFVLIM